MQNIKTFIIEKLKITPKNGIKTTIAKFVGWYKGIQWFRVNRYDIDEMPFSEKIQHEFGSVYNASEFLYKRLNDEIIVDETLSVEVNRHCALYEYSFDLDGKEFIFDARIYDDSELLSNSLEYIEEKLKVSSSPENNFEFMCTVKDFFLWYWNYKTVDDDFWDAMYEIEFQNNVIEDVFNGNTNEFVKWLEPRLDDIMYFNEKILNRDTVQYNFLIDDIEFKLLSYSDDSNTSRFSKTRSLIK